MHDEALPFLAGAILALVGAAASWATTRRTEEWAGLQDAGHAGTLQRPVHATPSGISRLVAWGADASQALTAIVSPGLSGLLLLNDTGDLPLVLYTAVLAVGVIAFVILLFAAPGQYVRIQRLGVSLLTLGVLTLNLALFATVWIVEG